MFGSSDVLAKKKEFAATTPRSEYLAMRFPAILSSLLLLVLLTACPAPKAPLNKTSTAVASPTPLASRPNLPTEKFVGSWAATDQNGQAFDLVLFPNGQAITTRSKGPAGAMGERGFWRTTPQGATAFFADGWTDHLLVEGDGILHQSYAPDLSPGGTPTNQSPAVRTDDDKSGFVGLWRLNKEADGSYLSIVLQSSGRAFSNVNGEGKWETTPEGARCTWTDGWNDLIFRSPEGYQKRSWVGPEQNATPPDISDAVRVGESKFQITP